MNKWVVLMLASASLLSGCSTGYRCDLGEQCTNSIDALEAAKENGGNTERVIYEPDPYKDLEDEEEIDSESAGEGEGQLVQFGRSNLRLRPVYIPDAPMRIWIAPVKYEEESLLVGDYEIYTVLKGRYSIGNLGEKGTGNAGGLIGPLNEKEELGFKPTFENSKGRVRPNSIFN